MKQLDFMCIGVQKGATTSIHQILKQHQQIFLPSVKEVQYFDRDENFLQGINWYAEHYKDVTSEKAVGEVCPSYIYDEKCPKRIFDYIPKLKLILILRNPADRAFSQYKMRVGRGDEKRKFKDAVKSELQKIKNKENYPLPEHYIARGFYDKQIIRYFELFDKKNILILFFKKDFLDNKKETIKKILDFIEVDSNVNLPLNIKATPEVNWKNKKVDKLLNTANPINQFAKKIIPSKKTRIKIKYFFSNINQKATADKSELDEIKPFLINEVYKESILNLEKLIDKDLSSWLK
ncbi:MAG: sulfotransferase domain-containing protein [Bacteroidales bacterium]|nr:sulfotransferase domain-containing protein [Bacteroidales bacterium]